MRIYSAQSIFAVNSFARTSRAIARSMERLASGKRVNSPKDDVAAYSLSTTLDSQIRGLDQSIRNINQTKGLIETADSALGSQLEIVQQMRELALQATNSSLSKTERDKIQNSIKNLMDAFSRISSETEFNGIHLLDGSFGTRKIQMGSGTSSTMDLALPSMKIQNLLQTQVGTGTFKSSKTFTNSASGLDTKYVDINNDGHIDILGSAGSQVRVSLGTGSGVYKNVKTFSVGYTSNFITVGDFNNDKFTDILIGPASGAANPLLIYFGNGDGTFRFGSTVNHNAYGQTMDSFLISIPSADLNNDGNLDLFLSDGSGVLADMIFLGNGDGTFRLGSTFTNIGLKSSQILEDINADGLIDLIYADVGNTSLAAQLGNGDGTFKSAVTLAGSWNPNDDSLAVGDMNNDGYKDIVLTEPNAGGLFVFKSNGDGTFAAAVTLAGSSLMNEYPVLGDINNDGLLDIIGMDGAGNAGIFINNGGLSFSASTLTINSVSEYGLVDINEDGILDIVRQGRFAFYGNSQTVSSATYADVSNVDHASRLADILNTTIQTIESERSKIAAYHSRLDFAADSHLLLSETLDEAKTTAAEMDVNEIAELVRNQILQNAQTAVLAQSNLNLQIIAQLLKT